MLRAQKHSHAYCAACMDAAERNEQLLAAAKGALAHAIGDRYPCRSCPGKPGHHADYCPIPALEAAIAAAEPEEEPKDD